MMYQREKQSAKEFRIKHSKYIEFAKRVFEVRTEPAQWNQHNGKRVMTYEEFYAALKDPSLIRSLRSIPEESKLHSGFKGPENSKPLDMVLSDEDIRLVRKLVPCMSVDFVD